MAKHIKNKFNPIHDFNLEIEKDKQINFLDITILRNYDNTLASNWFTKITHSGRYTNFFSVTNKKYKIGLINSLVDRPIPLSSNNKYHHNNIKKITTLLENNNFSLHFIQTTIKKKRIAPLKQKKNSPKVEDISIIPKFLFEINNTGNSNVNNDKENTPSYRKIYLEYLNKTTFT